MGVRPRQADIWRDLRYLANKVRPFRMFATGLKRVILPVHRAHVGRCAVTPTTQEVYESRSHFR